MMILPNMGAEEGHDWHAYLNEPHARAAARLFSLLFSRHSQIRSPTPSPKQGWTSENCEAGWPPNLGPPAKDAVFSWLESVDAARAWLNTRSLEEAVRQSLGLELEGPSAACIAPLHDKAFSVVAARALDLVSPGLDPLIQIIDPEALRSPDALIQRLDAALAEWPDWTRGRFTLKPRFGSSGRGRVASERTLASASTRSAFARLAERGGAIFEPWLDRRADLSVSFHVPAPGSASMLPTILGSLDMIASASGVFRGHSGEFDSRGRVFSGHPADEALRADAAAVATRAAGLGFFGPCGVDAFSYLEGDRERLRSLVEFNARTTMGLVTIGLVRRALPQVRDSLELTPGSRRGFLLTFVSSKSKNDCERLIASCGSECLALDLGSPRAEHSEPRPVLLFGRERARLRQAHHDVFGC